MSDLRELSERLRGQALDLQVVLGQAVEAARKALGADRATLYLVDHARQELVSRVSHLPELAEIRLRLGEGLAGWVARTGAAVRLERGRPDPRFTAHVDHATGYRTENLLAVPVRSDGGVVVGVLQVLNRAAGDFGPEDEARLASLAEDLGRLLLASSLGSQLHPAQAHPLSVHFNRLVGDGPAMQRVFERIRRAAPTEAAVLLRGETGTGKDLVAHALHVNSPRREGPFVKVEGTSLPEALVENELYGHERGAYTGADRPAEGKVRAAEGGTLFIDEVGDLPLPAQGRLLRLLQDRTYVPVGGTRTRTADVRFVCATHRELEAMVAAGRFREDLYYRIRVVEIRLPPLRERGHGDLDRLVDHFLHEHGRRHGRRGLVLAPEARARLHAHGWPGNVRELEHCLEAAVVLAPGPVVGPESLPLGGAPGGGPAAPADAGRFSSPLCSLPELEAAYIRHVLALCGGNRTHAARRLGIGRSTLLRHLGRDGA